MTLNQWRGRRPLLRDGSAEHAEHMSKLHRSAFPRGWSAEEMARLMEEPSGTAVLAWRGKGLLGFAMARAAADEAEVLSIVVSGTARRRGLGAVLLASLEQACRERGVRMLFLEVSERNTGALALYYRADYRQIGRRPRYYEDGAAALTMRKSL